VSTDNLAAGQEPNNPVIRNPDGGTRRRRTPGLAGQVLIGLGLGVVAGIVFGEWMRHLQIIGDVFVGLLQMTVLPYIVVSLVASLGRLTYREVRLLATKGGAFILLFWLLAVVVVLAMVTGFPDWESATFFSTSLIEEREAFNIVKLYIPANPFSSLSNGIIPAIVLASLAGGLALIAVPGKDYLLKSFDLAADAVMRIAQFVVRLAPFGVFALVASTAGTMSIEEIGRLQVYLLTYIGAALLLSFWVLPGLVAVMTPIPYRRVLSGTQDALITAFATYNLLIVLPLLSERIKEMLDEVGMLDDDTGSAADLIVPINFNLPNLGKLLALGFIPFAGWFAGAPMGFDQYPQFLTSGLFSFFGEVVIALPFLLDQMRIPADTFQIFLAVDQFSGRFGTLLAGMHTVVLGLLTAVAVSGHLQVHWFRLGRFAVVSVLLGITVFGGLRLFFEYVVPQEYRDYNALIEMDLVEQRPEVTLSRFEQVTPLAADQRNNRFEAIRKRGRLHVGYLQEALPFAYLRGGNELIGIDVDMMNMLANDLSVNVAFVSLSRDEIAESLRSGRVDIVIGGLFATPDRALDTALSEPYMEASLSLVVRDHRRREFHSWQAIDQHDKLKLAVVDLPFLVNRVEKVLRNAQVKRIAAPTEYFTAEDGRFDAMLYSAEAGSAWTLLYPQYSVVVPEPYVVSIPVAFALPPDTARWNRYVNAWIGLNKTGRRVERLYDYWILGRGAEQKKRRWSVIHNVLGWGSEEKQ
jgi:Na+/H+-dicarboxylate symporter/ABC-type amino acid transport substrate-binding protein